jgi:hypothetical protein
MATDPASGHPCTEVVGLPSIVLVFDDGRTLVQSRTPRDPATKVVGVVSLGTPYALAAIVDDSHSRDLFISVDGGCHWTDRGKLGEAGLTEGHDGIAYAWGGISYAVSVNSVRPLRAPPAWHIAVDSADRERLTVMSDRDVFKTSDGGETWQKVGALPAEALRGWESVAVAPSDTSHVLYSDNEGRVYLTRDGGGSWVRPAGPVRGMTLWIALDGQQAWSFGPLFFRSTDGGATFEEVPAPEGAHLDKEDSDIVLLGAQPDSRVLTFAAKDAGSHFLLRFDPKSLQSTKLPIGLAPGNWPDRRSQPTANGPPVGGGDWVVAGTFVPGEPGVICLAVKAPFTAPWYRMLP